MSLKQLELRYTNKTEHCVLNMEQCTDMLLNYSELRQMFGKTPKFLPIPGNLKPKNVARDCGKSNTKLINS